MKETDTPVAVRIIEKALGSPVVVSNVDREVLGWRTIPADARVLAVRIGDANGDVVAYVHSRRGHWKTTIWSSVPPDITTDALPPTKSPKEEYGRGVIERAHQEAGRAQPAVFMGVIGDALVFAGDRPDVLWDLLHETQSSKPEILSSGWKDGMAGSPRLYEDGVAEWGRFPYSIPEGAAGMVMNDERVSTVILRAVDASAYGLEQVEIMNRQ